MKKSKITKDIIDRLPSPCWLLEEEHLLHNLEIAGEIKKRSGVKILLALKGFALWKESSTVMQYLDGCCASGLHEAILAREEYGGEVHTYSPGYREQDIKEIASISDHVVFNSPRQLDTHIDRVKRINPDLSTGLRVNPEFSEAPAELYNPCAPFSRLGTPSGHMNAEIARRVDGLHFHALCEQDSSALERLVEIFSDRFGKYLSHMRWVNFGGGHLFSREGYDIDKLISILNDFKRVYPHLQIYMEPGEAIGWETGVLAATVLDIVHNGMDIAILDTSAEAHMPDTVIMPYRAEVRGAGAAGEKRYTYRLAGNTCLAGDIMGDYSFDRALQIGDRIIFEDQMHYTMVKATTFNGIPLPSIAILRQNGDIDILRDFEYMDFKSRLC